MNKRILHPATVFFLLTLWVAVFSWVGSIYEWTDVRSLLSSEGFRWLLRSLNSNFVDNPFLGNLLIIFFGLGLWMHSGLWALLKRILIYRKKPSRKEQRALVCSMSVGIFCCIVCCTLAWGPWGIVRSIRGTLSNSPFMDGFWCLVSTSMGLMSIVYAYSMDYYRRDKDIVDGMSYSFVRLGSYFVILFFASQFFACFHYTHLDIWAGISERVYNVSFLICCILSLLWVANKSKNPNE